MPLLAAVLALGGCATVQTGVTAVQEAAAKVTTSLPVGMPNMVISATGDARIGQLYQKRRVTGKDLLSELVQLRSTSARGNYARTALLGNPLSYPGPRLDTPAAVLSTAASNAGLDLLENLLNRALPGGGSAGLAAHLSAIEGSELLATETIDLPSGDGLNFAQKRRIVSMAAMVLAMRITNKQLEKAREDFAGVENDYAQMIERREKAAQLLYDFLQAGGARNPELNAEDMAYLRARRSALSIQDFATDMGVQNLALRYLRQKDPAAWQDYRNTAERTSKRTTAYVRTMLGGVAFTLLARSFGRDLVQIYKGKQVAELLVVTPMMLDFGNQFRIGAQTAWDLTTTGLFADLGRSFNPPLFRWETGDGQRRELATAKQVFEALGPTPSAQLFKDALIRDGAVGLIYRVYLCDRPMAGRLLDATVDGGKRDELMRAYLQQSDLSGFSFAGAFETPAAGARAQELGDTLLRTDQRRLTSDRTGSLAQVPRGNSADVADWNNDHLMRLIFANREGSAARAALQLGGVTVQAVPSMQSIYAYEEQVEGCKSLAQPAPSPAPSPGKAGSGKGPATAAPAPAKTAPPKPVPTPKSAPAPAASAAKPSKESK